MHSFLKFAVTIRLCLDVDIQSEELNWPGIPKLRGIGNSLEYQCHCLDVQLVDSWNRRKTTNYNSCLDVQSVDLYVLKSLGCLQ